MSEAIKEIFNSRIYGIIREDNPNVALEVANAYLEGGIRVIEINSSVETIKKVASLSGIYVAQGGVITSAQAHQGISAGVKLLVSPIYKWGLQKFHIAVKSR